MLHDCAYDKIKLIHQLSSIAWFIEKHAKENAKKAHEEELLNTLEALKTDMEKYLKKLAPTHMCK